MKLDSYSKIIDISLTISEETIIYPGNPEVKIQQIQSASGSSWHSALSLGTHTATHLDAPSHVMKDGMSIEKVNLEQCIGKCRVLDATKEEESVSKEFLIQKNIKNGERLLLKTKNSQQGYAVFNPQYVYVSAEAAAYCAQQQILLLGIDYLSVKQKGSVDNRPHTELLQNNIVILEGINLQDVDEGEYTLIALPLKLEQGDGSPTRAVLLQ